MATDVRHASRLRGRASSKRDFYDGVSSAEDIAKSVTYLGFVWRRPAPDWFVSLSRRRDGFSSNSLFVRHQAVQYNSAVVWWSYAAMVEKSHATALW